MVRSGSIGTLVIKKFLLDQAVFAPAFTASLMVALGTVQWRTWNDMKHSLQANYMQMLKARYILWPAAQLINFLFVPSSYRQPFGSCVAVVWCTYLAWKANTRWNDQRVDTPSSDSSSGDCVGDSCNAETDEACTRICQAFHLFNSYPKFHIAPDGRVVLHLPWQEARVKRMSTAGRGVVIRGRRLDLVTRDNLRHRGDV
ncbi:hypothetical protein HPB50_009566 [Hyalomma asiaticum]|uniref:Uncharacterized protein n=1 Tax=Hyalomma asiaticum TaxID=266040 RepID=A0ACB7RR61_HYAAI|nr:hypothetical protein HPB50_009566 [Hyalomma asiaticum]